MERMVPEVDYLVDKGYFSRTETRSIISNRLDFEYRLKAKVPEKEGYWRCFTSHTAFVIVWQPQRSWTCNYTDSPCAPHMLLLALCASCASADFYQNTADCPMFV